MPVTSNSSARRTITVQPFVDTCFQPQIKNHLYDPRGMRYRGTPGQSICYLHVTPKTLTAAHRQQPTTARPDSKSSCQRRGYTSAAGPPSMYEQGFTEWHGWEISLISEEIEDWQLPRGVWVYNPSSLPSAILARHTAATKELSHTANPNPTTTMSSNPWGLQALTPLPPHRPSYSRAPHSFPSTLTSSTRSSLGSEPIVPISFTPEEIQFYVCPPDDDLQFELEMGPPGYGDLPPAPPKYHAMGPDTVPTLTPMARSVPSSITIQCRPGLSPTTSSPGAEQGEREPYNPSKIIMRRLVRRCSDFSREVRLHHAVTSLGERLSSSPSAAETQQGQTLEVGVGVGQARVVRTVSGGVTGLVGVSRSAEEGGCEWVDGGVVSMGCWSPGGGVL
ncbi:hypothetical protein G7K_6521-t1 [Saitoella complicata NRRL Y-17804]|uniref:Uncharacterized protein n=1 Tax=Saitoella complicata (strain BCRC 22490 / CBS 7301 / JCM 7358 / NBRC 10748 / NRRL Y-17804) TaxID=698492 RepID=A0A0E9NSN6_SAICN|nr:hypothetical protein G7K_6521-t1 [Saitoella complicata NRRL Y-17804]